MDKVKCEAKTKKGGQCQFWAMPETDPPRCKVHGGTLQHKREGRIRPGITLEYKDPVSGQMKTGHVEKVVGRVFFITGNQIPLPDTCANRIIPREENVVNVPRARALPTQKKVAETVDRIGQRIVKREKVGKNGLDFKRLKRTGTSRRRRHGK